MIVLVNSFEERILIIKIHEIWDFFCIGMFLNNVRQDFRYHTVASFWMRRSESFYQYLLGYKNTANHNLDLTHWNFVAQLSSLILSPPTSQSRIKAFWWKLMQSDGLTEPNQDEMKIVASSRLSVAPSIIIFQILILNENRPRAHAWGLDGSY